MDDNSIEITPQNVEIIVHRSLYVDIVDPLVKQTKNTHQTLTMVPEGSADRNTEIA